MDHEQINCNTQVNLISRGSKDAEEEDGKPQSTETDPFVDNNKFRNRRVDNNKKRKNRRIRRTKRRKIISYSNYQNLGINFKPLPLFPRISD